MCVCGGARGGGGSGAPDIIGIIFDDLQIKKFQQKVIFIPTVCNCYITVNIYLGMTTLV